MSASNWPAVLSQLEHRHRRALEWFIEREAQEVPWPEPLEPGVFLASRAKGIFKPAWSKYALSVRQTLEGPYPDSPIAHNSDGSWMYRYFQESLDPEDRDSLFTNRGLIECWKDVVPVAVMIQTRGKPNVRYRILGLAFVNGWEAGYFFLHGISSALIAHDSKREITGAFATAPLARAELIGHSFDPSVIDDERRRVTAQVVARRGQAGFRRELLKAYEGRCAISGYDAEEALEAAHIVPYLGPVTNHPTNGLILRADLHTLFDLGLLAVHEESMRPVISKDLRSTRYWEMCSTLEQVHRPDDPVFRPSQAALRQHREWAGL